MIPSAENVSNYLDIIITRIVHILYLWKKWIKRTLPLEKTLSTNDKPYFDLKIAHTGIIQSTQLPYPQPAAQTQFSENVA